MSAISSSNPTEQGLGRLGRVGFSLLVALILIGAAWWVSGREGLSQLGSSGADASLLPKVGQVAPDVAYPDANGVMHRLSDLRGQPVWLTYWGSWCPPCKAEMPEMVEAYNTVKSEGVVLLAVSMQESIADAVNYAALNGAQFTVVSDQYKTISSKAGYGVSNYPTHIFIDREGIIRRIELQPLSYAQAVQYSEEIAAS